MIISSVKIYNRVLSPAEIWLKYMKEEKVKFCPSCGKIDVYLQTFKYYQMAGCFDCWW